MNNILRPLQGQSTNKCKEYDKSEKFITKYRPFIERMHLSNGCCLLRI